MIISSSTCRQWLWHLNNIYICLLCPVLSFRPFSNSFLFVFAQRKVVFTELLGPTSLSCFCGPASFRDFLIQEMHKGKIVRHFGLIKSSLCLKLCFVGQIFKGMLLKLFSSAKKYGYRRLVFTFHYLFHKPRKDWDGFLLMLLKKLKFNDYIFLLQLHFQMWLIFILVQTNNGIHIYQDILQKGY